MTGITRPPENPLLSVVLTTYNRAELLDRVVRSVLTQRDGAASAFELIVVDNHSTDNTREVVERFTRIDARVRYVFEPQQGSSFGRNAGIRVARAPLIVFIDDDVQAEPDWVSAILCSFGEHPESDVIGGRVLPAWPATPPQWLTRDHWAPLALVDHGEMPMAVTSEQPICLVSANLAIRRTVYDTVGGFAPDFQLVKSGILGSVEDHEFLLRVLNAGRTVLYDPRIIVYAEIQRTRLEPAYHRRWHTGHGHFHSLLRSEQMEKTSIGTFFGVPAHLYRQAVQNVLGWLRAKAAGDSERAFHHELRLRFFWGFFRTRRREFLQGTRAEQLEEMRRLLRLGKSPAPAFPLKQLSGPAGGYDREAGHG
jgi:glucosyl-dolichyl phosphate glucuronosyltransferase